MRPSLPDRERLALRLSGLGRNSHDSVFRKNQTIFSPGDLSQSIFYIRSGAVKLVAVSPQGGEAVVGIANSGSLLGEGALDVDPLPRAQFAIALTTVHAMRIAREAMLRLIRQDPDVCGAVLSYLVRANTALASNFTANLLYRSEQRLARALVALASVKLQDLNRGKLPLTQQDLANMIGVTRQRVNSLLGRFKRSGWIDYAGRHLVVHEEIRRLARHS